MPYFALHSKKLKWIVSKYFEQKAYDKAANIVNTKNTHKFGTELNEYKTEITENYSYC